MYMSKILLCYRYSRYNKPMTTLSRNENNLRSRKQEAFAHTYTKYIYIYFYFQIARKDSIFSISKYILKNINKEKDNN